MDSFNSPATEKSTIDEILERRLRFKELSQLPCIICIFDQAIHAKAIEVKWNQKECLKDSIIMLGISHMLMMYMGAIS